MAEEKPGQTQSGEDPRIDSLEERIRRADAAEQMRSGQDAPSEADEDYRLGNRILAELIGGIAGGMLFGWLFDRIFGTSPWLLLTFLFLGIVVVFRNIIRLSNEQSRKAREKAMAHEATNETGQD
ncbi:AtpZ/AtpI family protein [Sphingorhabdus sp. Alg239-R122]|uniref:AtpZ/AtpI family protein n=1 Tax=Sphingorhabdus sp. Alg239-R122 TaxID=2305989 RepID=UPI0013DC8FF5|nr:AtpZ/AtpI family protein [Sphingorhabdus sp. Alg239-R122]